MSFVNTINQIKFSLSLIPNDYKQGYRYSFLVSEPNKDYVEPGFNLPVFTDSNQLTFQTRINSTSEDVILIAVSHVDQFMKDIPVVQKIWVILSQINFRYTCKIRNLLNIGV